MVDTVPTRYPTKSVGNRRSEEPGVRASVDLKVGAGHELGLLAAEERRDLFGIGWRTENDVMATTRPHRCACIAGTAALHMATTESRLSSSAAA